MKAPFNRLYFIGKETQYVEDAVKKGKIVVISILITSLLYFLFYNYFTVFFEDNDDTAMAIIAMGGVTGSPDEHLIFINTLYGHVLKLLYETTTTIDWYSFVMIGLQFLAVSTIFYYLIRDKVAKPIILMVCFYFFYLITLPQFTNVSTLLAIAGLYCIYSIPPKSKFISYLYLVFLLFMSALLRFDAFILVFIIGICYVLIKREKLKNLYDLIYPMVLLGILICFSFYFNYKSYDTDEWKLYKTYNELRGKINDNPNLNEESIYRISNKTGLKVSEIGLFRAFTYSSSFDLNTLKEVNALVSRPLNFESYLVNLRHSINYRWLWMIIGLLFIVFFKNKKSYIIPIIILISIILFISLNHVPKTRVALPLFMEIIFFSSLFLQGKSKWKDKILVFIITFIPILFLSSRIYNMQKTKPDYLNSYNDYKELEDFKNYIVLRPISFIRGENRRPFKLNKTYKSNVIAYGWLNNSPLQRKQLSKMDVNSTLPISLIDNEELYKKCEYVTNTGNDTIVLESLKLYLKEKGSKLKLIRSKNKYNFYKIVANDNSL